VITATTADPATLLAALDPAARRAAVARIAPLAVSFELHRWREAVRGDRSGQASLLRLLERCRIGGGGQDATAAEELDARLAALPAPPRAASASGALAAWAERPDDADRAERWMAAQAAVGPNPVAAYPEVLRRESEDGSSVAEAALLVLADAVALAQHRSEVAAARAEERLALVEARYGRAVVRSAEDEGPEEGAAAPTAAPGGLDQRREDVLALLLRAVDLPTRRASIPLTAGEPASPEGPPASRTARLRRVAIGVLISLAFTGIVAALPERLPGRLPAAELSPATPASCTRCAAGDRLLAAGVQLYQGEVTVTAELAAPPKTTSLFVDIAHPATVLALDREAGRWGSTLVGARPFDPRRVQVLTSGSTVVIALPPGTQVSGISVATGAGSRSPRAGALVARREAPASVNWVDVLIVALLLAAGLRGLTAGLVATTPVLVGFVVNLALARLLYRPLGALMLGHLTDFPRVADSLAVGFVTAVLGVGTYLAVGSLSGRALRRLAPRLPMRPGSALDGALGSLARVLRATASAATLLALFVNLASVSLVATAANNSVIGRGLIAIWRHVYPGL
jgi:hypothetical protein